jgi:hypothetical protein
VGLADLDGTKSWSGGYRVERDRLLKFIDDQGINNVVFLTTDNHYTLINNLMYRQVPEDPNSPRLPARNAFEILTGPLGAANGFPIRPGIPGLRGRDAERRATQVWADLQQQAGVDPIGLEPGFPGLIESSIVAEGGTPGVSEPAAFASFATLSYAVLSVDADRLTVRVTGQRAPELPSLQDPTGLLAYAATTSHTILSFQMQAR